MLEEGREDKGVSEEEEISFGVDVGVIVLFVEDCEREERDRAKLGLVIEDGGPVTDEEMLGEMEDAELELSTEDSVLEPDAEDGVLELDGETVELEMGD